MLQHKFRQIIRTLQGIQRRSDQKAIVGQVEDMGFNLFLRNRSLNLDDARRGMFICKRRSFVKDVDKSNENDIDLE